MIHEDFDNMKAEQQQIVTIMLWFALVPLFITQFANSEVPHKPVGRETTNDNNPDFISIDCGSPVDYKDEETGIWYQTDKKFIETGMNHKVSPNADLGYPYFGKQLSTLRSFPEGDRNCYTLKPKQGKNHHYLIRAFFGYGNYDFKNQTPTFDVYIGVSYRETVVVAPYYIFFEAIHTPSSDTIHVCLVKTGSTIPYISSLELRLLNSSMYQIMSNNNPQSLQSLRSRIDVGAPQYFPYHRRYKDDIYDRIWRFDFYNSTSGWYPLNESTHINSATNVDAYKLPSEVLNTAAQSLNVSNPLVFDFKTIIGQLENFDYCVYFHFAEIEALPRGKKRIINNITLNSKSVLTKPLVLEYLKPVTIGPLQVSQNNVWFSIRATSESDAPPILNAYEIYKLITELDSPTDSRDVGAILDIKSAYKISKLNWQGDPCLPKQYAWEGLICNSATNPRITSLNLRSSKLTGEINSSISYLTELEFLDLSDNYLVGSVPEFLAELPKLKTLNLTGNKLSGTIPKALKAKVDTTLQLSVDGNPDLCVTNSCKKKNFVTPLVASLSAFFAILLISLGFWIFRRQKAVKRKNKLMSKKFDFVDSNKQEFTYKEVLSITNNFETIVGRGGFGTVYYGCIGEIQVAVKMLSPSTQGLQQFQTEAKILTRVHHKCLTPLIGYSNEGMALIYKFMPNGNLAHHLSERNQVSVGWNQRLQIALDSAIGLEYLHRGCKPPIVHRDVKTSNILLDQDFNAKISDFGLSRIFADEFDTHVSTVIAGTPGYLDPEYHKTSQLTEKSDVYSYGIVLLEIITGHPAIIKSQTNIHIIQWVKTMLADEGEINSIMDPKLQGTYDSESARRIVNVAMACVAQNSSERPTMNEVVIELKQCYPIENNNLDSTCTDDFSVATFSRESTLAR